MFCAVECDPVEGNIFEVDLIRKQKKQKTIITIILLAFFGVPAIRESQLSPLASHPRDFT